MMKEYNNSNNKNKNNNFYIVIIIAIIVTLLTFILMQYGFLNNIKLGKQLNKNSEDEYKSILKKEKNKELIKTSLELPDKKDNKPNINDYKINTINAKEDNISISFNDEEGNDSLPDKKDNKPNINDYKVNTVNAKGDNISISFNNVLNKLRGDNNSFNIRCYSPIAYDKDSILLGKDMFKNKTYSLPYLLPYDKSSYYVCTAINMVGLTDIKGASINNLMMGSSDFRDIFNIKIASPDKMDTSGMRLTMEKYFNDKEYGRDDLKFLIEKVISIIDMGYKYDKLTTYLLSKEFLEKNKNDNNIYVRNIKEEDLIVFGRMWEFILPPFTFQLNPYQPYYNNDKML